MIAFCDTGDVAEWLNVPDSKSGILARVSRVQIPSSPPEFYNNDTDKFNTCFRAVRSAFDGRIPRAATCR